MFRHSEMNEYTTYSRGRGVPIGKTLDEKTIYGLILQCPHLGLVQSQNDVLKSSCQLHFHEISYGETMELFHERYPTMHSGKEVKSSKKTLSSLEN